MGEQREVETKIESVESGRLRTRTPISQKDLDESFKVVSSFSYGNHLSTRKKSSKSLKDSPEAPEVSGTLIQNIQKHMSDRHQFNSGQNNKLPVNDVLADWLLEGRKIQESPKSSKNHWRTHSWHEISSYPKINEEDNVFDSLGTYPPFSAKYSRPQHVNNIYDEERSVFLPSFNPRPLGETSCSYKDWQKSRQKTSKINVLDDVTEVEKQVQLRQRSSPSCLNRRLSSTELRKESSTFRPNYSRSRSASLPTPTRYDCHVVMDWEERKNRGVTYVTPFLKESFPK